MEWIYPILGKQKCLPFYLSGIGIAEPEYHVIREEGLVSHQLHYTQSGRGNLVVGGATYPLEPGSMFYMAPGIPHEYYPLVEDEWTTCWLVFRGEHQPTGRPLILNKRIILMWDPRCHIKHTSRL